MTTTDVQPEEKKVATTQTQSDASSSAKPTDTRGEKKQFKRNPRRDRRAGGRERPKPEFDQKIVSIRRVTRVMAGGRRFSFSVSLVAGNRKGKVGVGVGKAGDTALAIEKAFKDAKKNMITVPLTKNKSIRHDVSAKYCSSEVRIQPAEGRGLVAGGAIRTVLELGGITDVTSKILSRSKNHLNNAKAALRALDELNK